MNDLNLYKISAKASIHDAMSAISLNKSGFIFCINEQDKLVGLLTDGDIRRFLIKKSDLSLKIHLFMNTNFIFVDEGVSKEKVLKLLDKRIKVIPVVNKNNELSDIYTKNNMPMQNEGDVFYRSRAPVRITFGGGGSDLTSYFSKFDGAVINASISIYSHATLKPRDDMNINIYSLDLGENLHADSMQDLDSYKGKFDLILSIIRVINPDVGFDLYIHSDFPMSSGLGGSATIAVAIIGCFNQMRTDAWDNYDIAELAFQAERFQMGLPGGWQDQYASVVGGFNFMEFTNERNTINSLRIPMSTKLELEESLILCYTGITHNSGEIHEDQGKQLSEKKVQEFLRESVSLTWNTRDCLLRGNLLKFGENLHSSWMLKRNFGNKITNKNLDNIYNIAIKNGAIGGKLLGAGGGGYFLFYTAAKTKFSLIKVLEKHGMSIKPFNFDEHGLESWKVRETN
jgi:D-glycero-alpha-D-manno-heptose-7-phosphate kinase